MGSIRLLDGRLIETKAGEVYEATRNLEFTATSPDGQIREIKMRAGDTLRIGGWQDKSKKIKQIP